MANSIIVEQAGQANWVKWNGECLVLLQLQFAGRKRASLRLESFDFVFDFGYLQVLPRMGMGFGPGIWL